ncbi:MAG: Dabb family protein [Acidimicrobiia bacterium]
MLRHIVLFNWKPDLPEGHVERTTSALAELPGRIPEIMDYEFGPNLGINPGAFGFAVTAVFASTDDYLVYRDHPAHKAFIDEFTAPWVESRAAIQFPLES